MTFLVKSCIFQKKVVPLHPKMKDIWKNSAQLLSANVVAQAIGLLVYPILTRLYSPDDFGLFNLFLSIGGVLLIISTLDYHNAVVLPKTDKQSRAVFHVGLVCLIGFTVLLFCVLPFSKGIASLFNVPNLAHWLWMMPVYVLAMGLWKLINNHYMRRNVFIRISGYKLSQAVLSAGSKIGFGSVGFTSGGLIAGSVLAPLIAVVLSIWIAGKKVLGNLLQWDNKECKQVAMEYANFPKYSLPRSLVNYLGGNLPILLLTNFFSLTQIGYFGMALTLGFRPLNMISSSFCQTFYQQTADAVNHNQPIGSFIRKFILYSLLIMTPLFAVLYFTLPWLTSWILGSGWEQTGELLQWMLPFLLVSTVSASLCFVSDLFGRQKMFAIIEVIYTLLRALALVLGIVLNDFTIAIAAYAWAGVLVQSFLLGWYLVLAKRYDSQLS